MESVLFMQVMRQVKLVCSCECINIMFGKELNPGKHPDAHSKSMLSDNGDDDNNNLREQIREKDKMIRKLSKEVERLRQTVSHLQQEKEAQAKAKHGSSDAPIDLSMFEAEINRANHLQEIITELTGRVNQILEELTQQNSFNDNTEEIRELLHALSMAQKNRSVSLLASAEFRGEEDHSMSISADWTKRMDMLEGAFRQFKIKHGSLSSRCSSLEMEIEGCRENIRVLQMEVAGNEEVANLRRELKEERKQREKLKLLLEKTEVEKNELVNQRNNMGKANQEIKGKTKEELVEMSNQLASRVKDLEKEKKQIMESSTKSKEEELKKYEAILKRLKMMKDKSRGESKFGASVG